MKMNIIAASLLIMGFYGLTYCVVREHFYVNKLVTWVEAQQYCRMYTFDLSTVASREEINSLPFFPALSCPNNTNYYSVCQYWKWIGIYTDSNNQTVWSGGDHEPFCSSSVQTVTYSPGMCGIAWNLWGVCFPVPCSRNLSFYCMMRFDVILVNLSMTWREAVGYCRNNYIDLVELKSQFWMNEAVKVGQAANSAYVWTGLRFLNGQWFWSTQSGLSYQAWSSQGQPQCPAPNLRCGALAQNEGVWEMRDCEEKLNFLCYRKSLLTPN